MNSKRCSILGVSVAAGLAGTFAASANAAIMDQIGTVPSFVTSSTAEASQIFEAAHATDDIAVVDDLTVSGPTLLTKVFSVEEGFGANFNSFSGVTAWSVEIYSSLAAADSSLIGDVYSRNFGPAGVTVTTPFGGSASSALFNASTLAVLPAAGTYYLAVLADNSFASNGEVGVYATTGVSNATPGGLNAYQINPAGGFGFTNNQNALNLDAAYAVVGVAIPEPATASLVGAAAGILTLSRRRGMKSRS